MEVIVQDANNIVIEVDQGRQGRGVEDVSLITVGADYYLLFTFTDGTTDQVGPIATTVTEVISAEVRNAEAVTILKGQPVYLYQAQGNLATVKLAYNTSDATSAKTLGLAAENIAPNAQGLVTCQGTLGGLNTSAYNEGDTLYLGATAGTLTNVKPQAPNHLVYIGVVERANAGAGQIYVRVQNGFELDEIHDVRIISPVNGNTLIYDASTSLWKNAGITAGSGINVTNGPASITVGNTGVLSFSGGTTGLTPATATTGAVSLAGTLSTANGGTGLSSFTANGVVYASSASALTTGSGFTFANERLRVDRTSSGDVLYGTALNANVGVFLERTGASPGSFRIIQTDSQESYFDASSASHKVIWRFNSVEQMRLTGTGLGIGTSSPSYKLHVAGTSGTVGVGITGTVAANDTGLFINPSAITGAYNPINSTPSATDNVTYVFANTNSSSANANSRVDVRATGAGGGDPKTTYTISGVLNWSVGVDNSDADKFKISGSDSPGTSDYLTIDTSGNLGINTTSPGSKLHVNYGNTPAGSAEVLRLEVQGNAAGGRGPRIDFYGPAGVGASARQATIGGLNGYISFTDGSLNQILQTAYGNTNTPYLLIGASSRLDVLAGRAYLQIGDASTFVNATTATTIYSNWYPWNGGGNLIVKNGFYGDINFDQSAGNWIVSSSASSGLAGGTATSVERIRIDSSGNLLVGTTTNTNSSRLTVNGTISETVSSVQYLVASQFDVGTAPNKIPLNQYLGNLAYQNASAIAGRVGLSAGTAALPSIGSATDAATGEWFPATSVMAWSTGGAERMRLDASGNLGLGVVPVAWNTSYRVLDMGAGAFMARPGIDDCYILQNAYFDTGWKYRYSGILAARYTQNNGVHSWSNAPSGTAGNAISFTQAMTLDASGNLGIGTTSPAFRLEVSNPDALPARFTRNNAGSNLGGLVLNQPNTTDGNSLVLRYTADTTGAGAAAGVSFCQIEFVADIHNQATRASSIRFTTSLGGVGDNQERLRITSTGNQIATQIAESAQNASVTLTAANLQTRIITSNAAVTLTLPTGTSLEGYTSGMATDTAFECTFIATTANAITIAANGNTTVGSLTVAGNTSGTFRFRKTAANTFTVYRVA